MDRTIEMCKIKKPRFVVEKRVMGADWSTGKSRGGEGTDDLVSLCLVWMQDLTI